MGTSLVHEIVEDYVEELDATELADVGIDTVHKGRKTLPIDSIVRPGKREAFVFVAQVRGSKTKFCHTFKRAGPVTDSTWFADGGAEIKCDLCNGDCPQALYCLRAYRRQQAPPMVLDPSI